DSRATPRLSPPVRRGSGHETPRNGWCSRAARSADRTCPADRCRWLPQFGSARSCVQHINTSEFKGRWHEFLDRATVGATVHIPDGFLSTPVWAALDAAAVPAAGYMVRLAQREFDEARIPLLGVMGAFVFAAQMINFPVGVGTTGHLVGGAL